ncbi:metallophosphoesterase family protein [Dictyobacter kobayashii]|uniref:Calcineurin-like phosphoesterase domain-containing protein n=1 Tax=Dictyobacter kobayashii TaxID=2014872 RepID=A0A402AHJ9_9CHLR|nr:metallophosphoesterase [Dictyobacter kobayashii]GCE18533.1 hypothetical protein KDK_23330 [Dictyobacter kobayashii]
MSQTQDTNTATPSTLSGPLAISIIELFQPGIRPIKNDWPIFEDVQELWQREGQPAFCVSPGDIIDTCALENYQLAKTALLAQFGALPFYPGVGNHEYYGPDGEDPTRMGETFTAVWNKPLRYAWEEQGIVFIMLDYPDPTTLEDPQRVYIAPETLAFLEQTLQEHTGQPVVIFLHCPLHNTVQDRDIEQHRDYNSLQHFFAPENSAAIRAILARQQSSSLFISGHTHSGWEAPNLVVSEQLGEHTVTFINLMSPWYTGTHTGPRLSDDQQSVRYIPDNPNIVPSFSFQLFSDYALIRVREHLSRSWLKEWRVPFSTQA